MYAVLVLAIADIGKLNTSKYQYFGATEAELLSSASWDIYLLAYVHRTKSLAFLENILNYIYLSLP